MFSQEIKKFVSTHCDDIADIIEVHDGVPRTFSLEDANRLVHRTVATQHGKAVAEAIIRGHYDCLILLDKLNDILGERNDLRRKVESLESLTDVLISRAKPFGIWKAVLAGIIGGVISGVPQVLFEIMRTME